MKQVIINDSGVVEAAIEVLRGGGVVMHPTETCYGFAVDVFNMEALRRVYELKGRDFNKPLSILVSSFEMAMKYGEFSEVAEELAKKYWPGPLSIVVPRRDSLPNYFNKGEDFVSIRVSDYPFCRELVERWGGPITTTSANISGGEVLYEVELDEFGEAKGLIDLVVDGGGIPHVEPSTIIKVDGATVNVLRQGGVLI